MIHAQVPLISKLDDGTTRIRRNVVDAYLTHIENLRLKEGEFYLDFILGLETGIFPKLTLENLTQAEVNEILGILSQKTSLRASLAPGIQTIRERVDHELAQIELLSSVHSPKRHSDAARVEHEKTLLKGRAA